MWLLTIMLLCFVIMTLLALLAPAIAIAGHQRLIGGRQYPKWYWWAFVLGAELLSIGGVALISTFAVNSIEQLRSFKYIGFQENPTLLYVGTGLLVVGGAVLAFVGINSMLRRTTVLEV